MKTILDYIVEVPNALPHELCDAIVEEYKDSNEWALGFMDNSVTEYLRNCKTIGISKEKSISINREKRMVLDKAIANCMSQALHKYKLAIPLCRVTKDSGYDLLRYKKNEFIKQHIDTGKQFKRDLSCSMGLNDDYEGGEFAFFDREKIIKVAKGSMLLFPSNFTYPHEILKVTDGVRYSIVTWLED
jgi:predicted 2-oxoglutarate/Fe(II)-dependent dioxygenase YbiX